MELIFKFLAIFLAFFGIIFLFTLIQSMPIWPNQLPARIIPIPPMLHPEFPKTEPLFALPIKTRHINKPPVLVENRIISREVGLANVNETIRLGW